MTKCYSDFKNIHCLKQSQYFALFVLYCFWVTTGHFTMHIRHYFQNSAGCPWKQTAAPLHSVVRHVTYQLTSE